MNQSGAHKANERFCKVKLSYNFDVTGRNEQS